ncbi:hypothetical protein Q3G72_001420 [Acer saccharum]|nr:hypothetical protein Q3G72_001420 [Acer saccharum]
MNERASAEFAGRPVKQLQIYKRLPKIANSVQVCDGRRDTDIRNRKKKDADEYDQLHSMVSSTSSISTSFSAVHICLRSHADMQFIIF